MDINIASPRNITVLGGGIIGVTTAYYLARGGNQVTLVEQNQHTGMETSFANGGLITPSMSDPWASPGLPAKLLQWIGRENSPFLIRPGALPGLFGWGLKFLGECRKEAWVRNSNTIFRLCSYSRQALKSLVDETGIDYDANLRGTLHLFHDQASMESTKRVADTLGAMGLAYTLLDAQGCIDLEPTLAPRKDALSGGIHYPDDEAGDAHRFTQELAALCEDEGVLFRYGERVRSLDIDGTSIVSVTTNNDVIETDTCVVALGNGSASVLRPLGIKLPIYPVKGYSVTFPVGTWNGAPQVPFADDARKIGIVRMGDRVRVAGTAEFTGFDNSPNPRRSAALTRYFHELFPGYPDPSAGTAWTGLRPMTPDGVPYLGRTKVRGLFLNTGHGHLGWTMSCGSAKVIADLVAAREVDIDLRAMTLEGR